MRWSTTNVTFGTETYSALSGLNALGLTRDPGATRCALALAIILRAVGAEWCLRDREIKEEKRKERKREHI